MFFKQRSIYTLKLSLDLFFLNITFILAAVIAQSFSTFLHRNYLLILLVILNFIWFFSSQIFDFYEEFESTNLSYQFIKIIKNSIIQSLTCVLFIFLTKEDLFTRNFIVLNFIILTAFILFRIIFIKKLFAYLKTSGKNLRNLIIIGVGEPGNSFLEIVKSNPEYGYNFIGFVDNEVNGGSEKNIIGSVAELDSLIPKYEIAEAVIALPNSDFSLIDKIISVCNKQAVRTFIIPDYFKFLSRKFRISQFGNFPIITIRNEPLEEFHWQFIKRSFDLFVSVIAGVILLSWLFPIIILAQKLFSRGPVFYIQDRIGKENKTFSCFKFRTMRINSDKNFIPTGKEDPRVTKLGSFLRKSNLDELPQLINVFLGDMSIVGPRPHAIAFNNEYKKIVEEIKLRNLVKPGITGWAQVHGFRGDAVDEDENRILIKKRVEYDLWYIENWSVSLDVQIILLTAWQILRGKSKGR